jgi:hypothetical protein
MDVQSTNYAILFSKHKIANGKEILMHKAQTMQFCFQNVQFQMDKAQTMQF